MGIGVDDDVAFQVEGDGYRIFPARSYGREGGAWRVYRRNDNSGEVVEEKLEAKEEYTPLADLFTKSS